MFVLVAEKKLAQNIGRSYSGSGNTAKSKTCIQHLKKNTITVLNKSYSQNTHPTKEEQYYDSPFAY